MAALIPYRPSAVDDLARQIHSVLQQGRITAVPTETFYALAVNPFDGRALERLCAVKGRQAGQPLLILLDSLGNLSTFADHVPSSASVLMETFWPGALTILFPARASVATAVTGGTGRVGVRLSPCQPLRELLDRVGPVTGTSANRTAAPPARTAQEVEEALGEGIDAIVDAGPTPGGLPSTVIEAGDELRIVREGAIGREIIEAALRSRGFSLKLV